MSVLYLYGGCLGSGKRLWVSRSPKINSCKGIRGTVHEALTKSKRLKCYGCDHDIHNTVTAAAAPPAACCCNHEKHKKKKNEHKGSTL